MNLKLLKAVVLDVIDLLRHFDFEIVRKTVPFCRQSKEQRHKWDITGFKDNKKVYLFWNKE